MKYGEKRCLVSDDIVIRLREGKGDDIVLFGMMYEAADEIERLQIIVENMADRNQKQNSEQLRIVRALEKNRDRWRKFAKSEHWLRVPDHIGCDCYEV